jgi:hypothetical protein
MRNISFALIIFMLSGLACSTNKIERKLPGVWVYGRTINENYLDDTTGYLEKQLPYIYDFKEDGTFFLRICGDRDTILSWSVRSDSILTMDSIDYVVSEINRNELILKEKRYGDRYLLILKRPVAAEIPFSPEEAEEILLSGIWSLEDTTDAIWQGHMEYFSNHTMIYRYRIFDNNLQDSADNLQLENWGITEYSGGLYYFNYVEFPGNGFIEGISQVLEMTRGTFTITADYTEEGKTKYILRSTMDVRDEVAAKLQGEWTAYNTAERTYGKYLPRKLIDAGRIALYEGPVRLTVDGGTFRLQTSLSDHMDYQMSLGRDGKTLILGEVYEEFGPKKVSYIYYELADILELSDTKLKLRLFNNSFYLGKGQELISYYINLIQEFERSDQ